MSSKDFSLRQVHYSPIATLLVGEDDAILDMNVAARMLLQEEIAGRPRILLRELMGLCRYEGDHPEQTGKLNWTSAGYRIAHAAPFESTFSLTTGRFGKMTCHGMAVPLIDLAD